MIEGNRVIVVEEHFATRCFLDTAHGLDILPGDEAEVELMRTVENAAPMRPALLDLDARVSEMDATGQDMAVLSLNPPGVQRYQPAAAVRLAREFNDTLAAIGRQRPGRLGGLGTVAPQDPRPAAVEIERIMGPLGLNGIMINSHTGGTTSTNRSSPRCWTPQKRAGHPSTSTRAPPARWPPTVSTGCRGPSGTTRPRRDCTPCASSSAAPWTGTRA